MAPITSWRQNGWGATRDITVDMPGPVSGVPDVVGEVQDLLAAVPIEPSGAPRPWRFAWTAEIVARAAPGAVFFLQWIVREGCGQIVAESAIQAFANDPQYPGSPPYRQNAYVDLHGSEIRIGVRVLGASSFVPTPGIYRIRVQAWIAPLSPHTRTEVPL